MSKWHIMNKDSYVLKNFNAFRIYTLNTKANLTPTSYNTLFYVECKERMKDNLLIIKYLKKYNQKGLLLY